MHTFTPETAVAAMELQQLVVGYWYDIDFNDARGVADFFTEDCSYVGGPQISYNGREGVRKFYDNVRATRDSARVIRHTVTNLRVSIGDKNSASVTYIIVSFAGSGTPPIHSLTGPSQVTDVRLECRRDADRWLIAAFHGAPIFVGAASNLNKLAKT